MAGKKKAKKKAEKIAVAPRKKRLAKAKKKLGRPRKEAVAVADAVPNTECRHVYCVVSRYATKTLCEFTTLEAAQEMVEANKQINDLELCIVVMPGAEYRSTEW